MSRSFGNLIGPVRFGRLASLAVFGAVCALFASGQTEDSNSEAAATVPPPYSLFQYSTLTGSGNAINATWVPALNSKGQTSYYDVTLLFDVDAEGNLTLAPGYPQVVHSPKLTVSSFKAGKYLGPGNVFSGKAIITVSGPSSTNGGATEWSLSAATGASGYTYPCSATWYVGSISSNPLYSRLKAAGITSTAWYYGVSGSSGCPVDSAEWYPDAGLSQEGNKLTIVSFTQGSFTSGGHDFNTPRDQITYTLSQ